MERFWLDAYPQGVVSDIDENIHSSIMDFLHSSCQRFPDNPAFSNFGTTLTFNDIDRLSRQFGDYLQHSLTLKKGDRLAIMLPNILQYPIALFGAMRVGLTIVNVDPMYTARELTHQLNDSGALALLFLENFGDVVEKTLPKTQVKHTISTTVGECLTFPRSIAIDFVLKHIKKSIPQFHIENTVHFSQAIKQGVAENCIDANLKLDDIAFLQYTGGTTGVSKGAILTHRNIAANVMQSTAWIDVNFELGTEKAITALPIYHIFSMTANVLTMASLGNENILITNPRDFKNFVKFLKKTDFSIIIGVNTLFRKLLNTPDFGQINFENLKLSFAGGMSVTADVAKDWEQATGSVIVEAYGLTETSPAVCINPLTITKFSGSIGLPISSTYVQIKDDAGNDLGIDTQGELCVKGPQVTQGYWNQPQANAQAFTEDGYFRTGDYAQIDARGYVTILDRKKDMILVSGFNVFPNEIENLISQHPDVLEAAAIGVPNADFGEVVKLFVVKDNENLTETVIRDYCKENLTAYKRPKEIVFLDELPKSNVGKILRKDLR